MRITSKGQVTIPADIRVKAGLLPETEVEFRFDSMVVTLHQAQGHKAAVRALYGTCGGGATWRSAPTPSWR